MLFCILHHSSCLPYYYSTTATIFLLPPSVRFLGKSLLRAPKNSAWNRFEKKTPRGIVLRRLTSSSGRRHPTRRVVWRTLDIDPKSVYCPKDAIRRGSSRPFHRGVKLPKIPQNDIITGISVTSLKTSQTEGVFNSTI